MAGHLETVVFYQGFSTSSRRGAPSPSRAHRSTLTCRLGLVAPEWAGFAVQATALAEQREEQSDPPVVKGVEFVPVARQGL